jgi:hypothetical protein
MNMATLANSIATRIHALINGALPNPLLSRPASAAIAYRKVAVNIPKACDITGSRAIQSTRRGE